MKPKKHLKQGAAAVEAVIAIALLVPILFSFIFGGYNFYLKQAENVNLNFEAGRFFSTMASCQETTMKTFSNSAKFARYDLILQIDENRKTAYEAPDMMGTVVVYCSAASWTKGYTFYIWTSLHADSFFVPSFYPQVASKGGYYVVE